MTNPPDYNMVDIEHDDLSKLADDREAEVDRIFLNMLNDADPSGLVEVLHNEVYADDELKFKYEKLLQLIANGRVGPTIGLYKLIKSVVKKSIENNLNDIK